VQIKEIKKNKSYTFISYQLPKPDYDKMRRYSNEVIQLKYKKSHFKKGKATFALAARSTSNFAVLKKILSEEEILIDSTACDYGDFLTLKMNEVQVGTYSINAWGCRYGKEFLITIK